MMRQVLLVGLAIVLCVQIPAADTHDAAQPARSEVVIGLMRHPHHLHTQQQSELDSAAPATEVKLRLVVNAAVILMDHSGSASFMSSPPVTIREPVITTTMNSDVPPLVEIPSTIREVSSADVILVSSPEEDPAEGDLATTATSMSPMKRSSVTTASITVPPEIKHSRQEDLVPRTTAVIETPPAALTSAPATKSLGVDKVSIDLNSNGDVHSDRGKENSTNVDRISTETTRPDWAGSPISTLLPQPSTTISPAASQLEQSLNTARLDLTATQSQEEVAQRTTNSASLKVAVTTPPTVEAQLINSTAVDSDGKRAESQSAACGSPQGSQNSTVDHSIPTVHGATRQQPVTNTSDDSSVSTTTMTTTAMASHVIRPETVTGLKHVAKRIAVPSNFPLQLFSSSGSSPTASTVAVQLLQLYRSQAILRRKELLARTRQRYTPAMHVFYQKGNSESDLPECAPRQVCNRVDVYSTPWVERQCRCPSGSGINKQQLCPQTVDAEDGHSVADRTRLFKTCEPVHTLPTCRYFRDITWTIEQMGSQSSSPSAAAAAAAAAAASAAGATDGKTNDRDGSHSSTSGGSSVGRQTVHCICPRNAVAYIERHEPIQAADGTVQGFRYSFACSPPSRQPCAPSEPCRLFTVKRRRIVDEVNTNTLCECGAQRRCPSHHTDESISSGSFFKEDNVKVFTGFCQPAPTESVPAPRATPTQLASSFSSHVALPLTAGGGAL